MWTSSVASSDDSASDDTGDDGANVWDKLEGLHLVGSSTRRVYESVLLTQKFVLFAALATLTFLLALLGVLKFPVREYAPWSSTFFLCLSGCAALGATLQVKFCTDFLRSDALAEALDFSGKPLESMSVAVEDLEVQGSRFYEPTLVVVVCHCFFLALWFLGFWRVLELRYGVDCLLALLCIVLFHFGSTGPRYVKALTEGVSCRIISQMIARIGLSSVPRWEDLQKEYTEMKGVFDALWDAASPACISRVLTTGLLSLDSFVAAGLALRYASKKLELCVMFLAFGLWNGLACVWIFKGAVGVSARRKAIYDAADQWLQRAGEGKAAADSAASSPFHDYMHRNPTRVQLCGVAIDTEEGICEIMNFDCHNLYSVVMFCPFD